MTEAGHQRLGEKSADLLRRAHEWGRVVSHPKWGALRGIVA